MHIAESVRTGFLEIRSHKMRSFLSFLAIAFGVAAILYTFAEVHQMSSRRQKAFDLAGPGRLEIKEKQEYVSRGLSRGLTLADALAIRAAMPDLHMVSPLASRWGTKFRHDAFSTEDLRAVGVSPEWRRRDWVYRLKGRFFDAEDLRSAARVCVVDEPGGWVEKPFWARFFPSSKFQDYILHKDLLGETVRIEGHLFTVVGVLKNPPRDKDPRWFSRSYGGSGTVYLPITTHQRYLGRGSRGALDRLSELHVDPGSARTVPSATRRIESLLMVRHRGESDYEIEDFRETIQGILNQTRQYAIAVMAVGIVAILAGGVGIMNVTLATIFSRIREIGIRRAVGATRMDILWQFVIEAMLLGLFGGIAGTGLGLCGVYYIGRRGMETMESLQWWHLLATLAISMGAGFVFSLYPAYHASKMDPVEALRYE
ncbi:MAG: ABC transporter permease [Elusimicrobiota bacterium]